jgi:UDP-3-O-[3-hydroxymyristoyl] glucosamine N-acyltransferase
MNGIGPIAESARPAFRRRGNMADLKVFAKTVEDEALTQVNLLLSQDAFRDCKVHIMPDVHVGKGCVIGETVEVERIIAPVYNFKASE